MVLATAAVAYARAWGRRRNQTLTVHWIGRDPALSLIRACCPDVVCHTIDSVLDQGSGALPPRIDICVDLQSNLRSRRLAWRLARRHGAVVTRPSKRYLARSLLVLAARLLGRSRLSLAVHEGLTQKQSGAPQYRLAAQAMARALQKLDGPSPSKLASPSETKLLADARPELVPPAPDPRLNDATTTIWLAVAPGASHPTKKAPVTIFEEILILLAEKNPAYSPNVNSTALTSTSTRSIAIVLLGDSREHADCLNLERRLTALPWPGPVLNLAGNTTLPETVAILAGCRAILSNDSSLAHIAEALGKPAFTLFGPTDEAFGFAPHLPTSRACSVALGCRPCSKHGKAPCRFDDQACFRLIDTRSTGLALKKVLS